MLEEFPKSSPQLFPGSLSWSSNVLGHHSDVLERLYTVGGGGVTPPPLDPFPAPRPPPPRPLPIFEADSQNLTSVLSAPRGFKLKKFWHAFGGDHRGRGGVPANLPPFRPPPFLKHHRLILCLSLKCPPNMPKSSFGLEKKVSYSA